MHKHIHFIRKPYRDIKNILLGCLLIPIPILNVTIFGYLLDCIDRSLKNKYDVPNWKDFFKLFIKGIIFALTTLGYLVPVMFLHYLILTFSTSNLIFLAGYVTTMLVYLLILFILPYAIVRLVHKESIIEAFNIPKVLKGAFSFIYIKDFFFALLLGLIIGIIGLLLSGLLYLISFLLGSRVVLILMTFLITIIVIIVVFSFGVSFVEIMTYAYRQINNLDTGNAKLLKTRKNTYSTTV